MAVSTKYFNLLCCHRDTRGALCQDSIQEPSPLHQQSQVSVPAEVHTGADQELSHGGLPPHQAAVLVSDIHTYLSLSNWGCSWSQWTRSRTPGLLLLQS